MQRQGNITRSERRSFGALCIFAVLTCQSQAYAQPQIPPESVAAYEQASEGERVRSLIELAKSKHFAIASYFLHTYPLQGPHAANRTLYIEGLVLRSQGDLNAAAEKFRAALADDPSLTLVRADLADTLYAMGETDSAKHHLELLETEAPDKAAALGIRSFINSLDTKKPYRFSAYVMAAPTSNINNGTSTKKIYLPYADRYITIDKDTRRKAALGLVAGGSAAYIASLGQNLQAVFAGGAEARVYDDSNYNSVGLSQSTELRHMAGWGSIGLGLVASEGFSIKQEDLSSTSYGPRASFSYQLTPRDTIDIEALADWTNYTHSIADDSRELSIDMSYTHGFSSATTMSVYGGFSNINKKDNDLSYDVWSGGASVYREFTHGITMDLGSELRFIGFNQENAAAQKFRNDVRSVTTLGLTKRDFNIFGFAPALQYTFVWNNSNIPIYDFTSHSVDLKLTKDF